MIFKSVESDAVSFDKSSALIIPFFEDLTEGFTCCATDADLTALTAEKERGTLSGKAQEVFYLPTPSSDYTGIVVLGLGKYGNFDAEVLRRAAGAACAVFSKQNITHVLLDDSSGLALPIEAFIEGILLGQYDYVEFKKTPKQTPVYVDTITLIAASAEGTDEIQAGCKRCIIACESTNWARDLANSPPAHMTPKILADKAAAMAKEVGCSCTIFDEKDMDKMGMGALLGVSFGSAEPPRLIVLEYKHPDATRTVAMVGKGVTFDTGGISIKPSSQMHEMKYDMCGSTAVLGAMRTICLNKPNINVLCVVPTTENKTGANAMVPGDIVRAYNGKTIEVHNTDAEGRLILADALAYTVDKYKPDAIIDTATLTGACVVALGHYAAAVLGNDEELAGELQLAAEASGERVWPLPLWDDYSRLMKGTHADLCNIGPPGEAGTITAAAFLKEFVGDTPWAHLDIAGVAWGGKHIPYLDPNHASGYGVRLFSQWILEQD